MRTVSIPPADIFKTNSRHLSSLLFSATPGLGCETHHTFMQCRDSEWVGAVPMLPHTLVTACRELEIAGYWNVDSSNVPLCKRSWGTQPTVFKMSAHSNFVRQGQRGPQHPQSMTEQFQRQRQSVALGMCFVMSDLGPLHIRNAPTSKPGRITICETAGKKYVGIYVLTYSQASNYWHGTALREDREIPCEIWCSHSDVDWPIFVTVTVNSSNSFKCRHETS